MVAILIIPSILLLSYIFINESIINKFSYLITATGYLSLIYLVIVLILPLINLNSLKMKIRTIGLASFYSAIFHFLLYIFDNNYDVNYLVEDALYRNYIISGYIALLFFIPMYITSFDYFKNRITNWRKLHKVVYLLYFFILMHIYFIIKADYIYLFIFTFLILAIIILKSYKAIYK